MDIVVTRYRYLKICGDVSKHNLGRLATNVSQIQKLFERAGHTVSEQDGYLAVESFYDWFFDDIYAYHSSVIAEFLNIFVGRFTATCSLSTGAHGTR